MNTITIVQVDCFGPGQDRTATLHKTDAELPAALDRIDRAYNLAATTVYVNGTYSFGTDPR